MIWSQEILDRNFSSALGNYYKLVRYLSIYPVLGSAIKFLYKHFNLCFGGVPCPQGDREYDWLFFSSLLAKFG